MLNKNGKQAHWDVYTDVIAAGDVKSTISFCVEHFILCYSQCVKEHGAFYVALSGGSTPKAIFQKLTASPTKEKIDWSKVYLFWSDERSAPATDPDSNYYLAMNAGFSHVPIPKENIFRMKAESKIEEMASEYERQIHAVLRGRNFDYVMLGMGEDGHTASLFPGTSALSEQNHLVVANWVPQKNTWRMTLTYPCINSASHIVIYVIGSSKKNTLKSVLEREKHFLDHPIVKIGCKEHKALYICDDEAAELIKDRLT